MKKCRCCYTYRATDDFPDPGIAMCKLCKVDILIDRFKAGNPLFCTLTRDDNSGVRTNDVHDTVTTVAH
jgi:hypothetical protein